MSDTAPVVLPRLLINLIGIDIEKVNTYRRRETQVVQVLADGDSPILLVWESLTMRKTLEQAAVLWNMGVPALVSEDPEEAEALFHFLLEPHP